MRKIYYSKALKPVYAKNSLSYDETLANIKRDLILFDQIIFPSLKGRLQWNLQSFPFYHTDSTQVQLQEFDYLIEKGLIDEWKSNENQIAAATKLMSEQEKENMSFWLGFYEFQKQSLIELAAAINSNPKGPHAEDYRRMYFTSTFLQDNIMTLAQTECLKKTDNLDIINSQKITDLTKGPSALNRHEVFKFHLENLPLPSETTPWQVILDYKEENNSQRRIAALRNWINKVLKDSYTENELVDEYEDFYRSFEHSIQTHRMKTNTTRLEITFFSAAEFVEDILNKRITNLLKRFTKAGFSIKKEQIAMSETEASAKGSEIAYQFFTKEKFSK